MVDTSVIYHFLFYLFIVFCSFLFFLLGKDNDRVAQVAQQLREAQLVIQQLQQGHVQPLSVTNAAPPLTTRPATSSTPRPQQGGRQGGTLSANDLWDGKTPDGTVIAVPIAFSSLGKCRVVEC